MGPLGVFVMDLEERVVYFCKKIIGNEVQMPGFNRHNHDPFKENKPPAAGAGGSELFHGIFIARIAGSGLLIGQGPAL